jgi:hypothetical protein
VQQLSRYTAMHGKKRVSPNKNRRGMRTPEDLKEAAEIISIQAGNLLAQAKSMEEMKIKAVTVDGQTKWDRGMKLVAEFVGNVEVAIIRERTSRF